MLNSARKICLCIICTISIFSCSCRQDVTPEEKQMISLVNHLLENGCAFSSYEDESDFDNSLMKDLEFNKITKRDVKYITGFACEEYLPTLNEMGRLCDLEYLTIFGFIRSGVTEDHLKIIADKKSNTTQIKFFKERLSKEDAKSLIRLSKLDTLAFYEMDMTDDILKYCSNILVDVLYIQDANITEKGLMNMLPLTNLRGVGFINIDITDNITEFIDSCPNLNSIHIQ